MMEMNSSLRRNLPDILNVFRAQASDPSTFEMIQKIATLQKRLIAKTEEVVENELLISEKEKLYLELKQVLARQPGPEVAEQINVYQQTLKEKTKQLKVHTLSNYQTLIWNELFIRIQLNNIIFEWASHSQSMASELNMYESQIQEHKFEIERVSRELHDVKKKYYSQKRKEQLTK